MAAALVPEVEGALTAGIPKAALTQILTSSPNQAAFKRNVASWRASQGDGRSAGAPAPPRRATNRPQMPATATDTPPRPRTRAGSSPGGGRSRGSRGVPSLPGVRRAGRAASRVTKLGAADFANKAVWAIGAGLLVLEVATLFTGRYFTYNFGQLLPGAKPTGKYVGLYPGQLEQLQLTRSTTGPLGPAGPVGPSSAVATTPGPVPGMVTTKPGGLIA